MAFSLKLKKKIRFSSPLSDQSIFPSSWSVPIDSDQEAGKYSWKFHKNLKIFWVFFPFFQISGVSDWALDQSHQESGKIYPIFMYTKWLQSITVIISEELCFVSHQYWSYHIVSLLPDHYPAILGPIDEEKMIFELITQIEVNSLMTFFFNQSLH